MKVWTYAEARDQLLSENDLQDETFILPAEMIGYFNKGIEEAESEIHKIDEDYFLTKLPVPLITGTATYSLPYNMYAQKLRGIIYSSGATIYEVRRFKRGNKLEEIAYAGQSTTNDDYRYYLTNPDSETGFQMNLVPASRETATLSPNTTTSTPMYYHYLRQAQRIPILGEYIPRYEQILQGASTVSVAANTLTIAETYVDGDAIKLTSDTMIPPGLVAGTVYYVHKSSSTVMTLHTTYALAIAGTSAVDITGVGSGILTISIAANQTLIDNTLIDIPEFTSFVQQYAKMRCYEKEGDPRLEAAATLLQQMRAQMVSTLTEAQQDDDTGIQMDLSHYRDMS